MTPPGPYGLPRTRRHVKTTDNWKQAVDVMLADGGRWCNNLKYVRPGNAYYDRRTYRGFIPASQYIG